MYIDRPIKVSSITSLIWRTSFFSRPHHRNVSEKHPSKLSRGFGLWHINGSIARESAKIDKAAIHNDV